MKRLLPPNSGNRRYLEIAIASFALGIIVTFFLSTRILVIIEAVLLVAVMAVCLGSGKS